jgi:predicted  nucleic acid-binding Zn-ribbon protein
VKNQQQYAAAWKEIDASRKHVKDLEESVMKNMGDAEVLQGQLDEKQQAHTELQGRYDTAHAEWQHSLADLRKEAADLRKKIEAVEATITPRLKAEFHKISRQRQGIAVTRTTGDSCISCRSRVRPAVAQQIKRGELVFCEGCHRMLYGK